MDLEEDNTYKKTLFDLFAREYISHKYVNEISKGSYSSRSIGSLLKKLNGATTAQQQEPVTQNPYENGKRSKDKLTQFDVFVGAMHNEFPTAFNGFYTNGNKISSSTTPTGGLNFTYFMSSHFNRFAVGVSLGFNHYNYSFSKTDSAVTYNSANWYYTTHYTETGRMSDNVVVANIYGVYFFNPLSKVKVYGKAGVSTNISLSGNNNIVVDYESTTSGMRNGNEPIEGTAKGQGAIDMRSSYYNINGSFGLNAGKHKIEFTYYTPGVMNVNLLFKVRTMGLFYYYTFSK
jgi:hypothetical protein